MNISKLLLSLLLIAAPVCAGSFQMEDSLEGLTADCQEGEIVIVETPNILILPSSLTQEQQTLMTACCNADWKTVKRLVKAGAPANTQALCIMGQLIYFHTPLTLASSFAGNPKIMQFLIDHGADVNAQASISWIRSTLENNTSIITKYLRKTGAIEHAYIMSGPALFYAIMNKQAIELLLQAKADPNLQAITIECFSGEVSQIVFDNIKEDSEILSTPIAPWKKSFFTSISMLKQVSEKIADKSQRNKIIALLKQAGAQ